MHPISTYLSFSLFKSSKKKDRRERKVSTCISSQKMTPKENIIIINYYVNNENKKPATQYSKLVTHESNKRTKSIIFKFIANM